ncbi:hypothetical protein GBAR_LOCUS22328 [Geodia barretti]|uniref:Uncharacterized protein n=1 Tax=Geodia barretti TaxID=519541 RepID=A0AA35T227_GEOBA|nr:hypothetical protein GBAR_LOCUS22328 [Geodia barretti]
MGLLVGTTMILALVFLPRMVGLYNDPEGKNVFSMTDPNQSTEIREDSSTTETLRYRIRELEKQLEKKKGGVVKRENTAEHNTQQKNGSHKMSLT